MRKANARPRLATRSFAAGAFALAAIAVIATGSMTARSQDRVPGLTGIDRADDVITARQLLMEGIEDEMKDIDVAAGGQSLPLDELKSHAYMISTLLSVISAARPKIASYPHTTVRPELGVMFTDRGEPITIVEIPGERYLRHLERARLVALVVDASDPVGIGELHAWAGDRPTLVVNTKSDLLVGARRRRKGIWISAETGEGVEEVRQALISAHDSAPVQQAGVLPERRVRLVPSVRGPAISVARRDWGLEVEGARVERLLERYDLETPAGFDRFQVALDRMGVNAALEEAGAQPGETVRIGESEFEYQP